MPEKAEEVEVFEGEAVFEADEDAGGAVIHISDGVFEATEDEEEDGAEECGDFAAWSFGGEGHPNCDADEEITENTTDEGFDEAEVGLGDGGVDYSVGGPVQNSAVNYEEGDEEGA